MLTNKISCNSDAFIMNEINYGSGLDYSKNYGTFRYNRGRGLEVYNENSGGWEIIGQNINLDLSHKTKMILDWAQKAMEREAEIETLAKKYEAVANLKQSAEEINQQLQTVVALVKEHKNV
jgi:hypothetical protein